MENTVKDEDFYVFTHFLLDLAMVMLQMCILYQPVYNCFN